MRKPNIHNVIAFWYQCEDENMVCHPNSSVSFETGLVSLYYMKTGECAAVFLGLAQAFFYTNCRLHNLKGTFTYKTQLGWGTKLTLLQFDEVSMLKVMSKVMQPEVR